MAKTKEEQRKSKKFFSNLEKKIKRIKKENKPTKDYHYHTNDNYGIHGSLYLKF